MSTNQNDVDIELTQLKSFRFHSDCCENMGGFQIEYNTLEQFTACGGTYSNASGVLSSPSFPNQYPEMTGCVYLISQPNGTYINISFITLDINCQATNNRGAPLSDFMEIRDGNSTASPLMMKFCGNGDNNTQFMMTTQNQLRIR